MSMFSMFSFVPCVFLNVAVLYAYTMYTHMYILFIYTKKQQYKHAFICRGIHDYGVATISRLLKIIGLFCTRALYKRLYSAKETYNFE